MCIQHENALVKYTSLVIFKFIMLKFVNKHLISLDSSAIEFSNSYATSHKYQILQCIREFTVSMCACAYFVPWYIGSVHKRVAYVRGTHRSRRQNLGYSLSYEYLAKIHNVLRSRFILNIWYITASLQIWVQMLILLLRYSFVDISSKPLEATLMHLSSQQCYG